MRGGANNTTETGDECWGTDNATMSLNGSGGELIKDGTTGVWRITNDDNSTVERLTDTGNGDNEDVITASGTWSLDASIGDLNGPRNQLTLHTREVMGRPDSGSVALRAQMQGSDVVVSFYIGDPDLNDRVVYTKCTSNCPTVTPRPTG
jgi:hypothetical protein